MTFSELSPYEILGVSPSASMEEIMQAYQAALRHRRYPAPRIAQAFNELRTPRKRAEHDLLIFSNLGDVDALRAGLESLPPFEAPQIPVEPVPSSPAFDRAARQVEPQPLPPRPLEFRISTRYDVQRTPLPPVPFPPEGI